MTSDGNLIVRDISFVCSEECNTDFHSIDPQQSVRDTVDFCVQIVGKGVGCSSLVKQQQLVLLYL